MPPSSLDLIRKALPERATERKSCNENDCEARTGKLKKLIVAGESLAKKDEKAVDCVFFIETDGEVSVVLVELKKRNYDARAVAAKMEASDVRAKEIVARAKLRTKLRGRAVFAKAHPSTNTAEYVLLAKTAGVFLRRCGSLVEDVLAKLE